MAVTAAAGAVAQGRGAPRTGVPAGTEASPGELGLPFVPSSAIPPALLTSPCANIGTNKATGGGSASPEALLSLQAPGQLSSPSSTPALGHFPLIAVHWEKEDGARRCKQPTGSLVLLAGPLQRSPRPNPVSSVLLRRTELTAGNQEEARRVLSVTSEH